MNNYLIDTHCHISLIDDIDMYLMDAERNNVKKIIISGCDKKSIRDGLEIIKRYDNIYMTIGYHPDEVDNLKEEDIQELENIIENNNKIIGIGEIGLDYYHNDDNKDIQKKYFIKQINLAIKLNLPIIVHTRDAIQDTYDILKEYDVKGILHCYSGSLEMAKLFIDKNFYLGIGGVLTFKNSHLKEVISEIPLENLVLETDSPYLSPEPYRGKKNSSKNIKIIAEKLSKIKNVSLEEITNITTNNANVIFDFTRKKWYILYHRGDDMKRSQKLSLKKYWLKLIYVFILLFIIVSGNNRNHVVTSNINNVKSIQSSRIMRDIESVKLVTNTKDISKYGSEYKIEFNGTLTGYGPDCEGCIGIVYCAPHPNVQNNNIYYTDKEYGKIRIVAADYSIPCGSIIKISNYKFMDNKDFYAIVLDRGSAIVGLTMDLLYASEEDTVIVGRQYNIKFSIERWGWK